jgi:hypothetical protein
MARTIHAAETALAELLFDDIAAEGVTATRRRVLVGRRQHPAF